MRSSQPVQVKCAICKRPVDRLDRYQDIETRSLVFEARCHGAREVVKLPMYLIEDATAIEVGTAFATPYLGTNVDVEV